MLLLSGLLYFPSLSSGLCSWLINCGDKWNELFLTETEFMKAIMLMSRSSNTMFKKLIAYLLSIWIRFLPRFMCVNWACFRDASDAIFSTSSILRRSRQASNEFSFSGWTLLTSLTSLTSPNELALLDINRVYWDFTTYKLPQISSLP